MVLEYHQILLLIVVVLVEVVTMDKQLLVLVLLTKVMQVVLVTHKVHIKELQVLVVVEQEL